MPGLVAELRSEQAQHRQELAEASADLKAAREAVTDAEQLLTEAFRHRATMEAKYEASLGIDATYAGSS